MIKNLFCTPKLRPSSAAARRHSPAMSLLDRLRNAVFRLIMLSALSKDHRPASSSSVVHPPNHHHRGDDPHHTEAVADCIEFIKKSACNDHSAQVPVPLPVT